MSSHHYFYRAFYNENCIKQLYGINGEIVFQKSVSFSSGKTKPVV